MKKRALSLIEVMISLGLLTLLLSTLFYWYHSLSQQKSVFNKLKGPLMEERYAHQRLYNLFSKTSLPFATSSEGSLVFFFDRGPYPVAALSGKVLCRLYLDSHTHSLCLGVWPDPKSEKTEPFQTSLLLEGVEACTFEFYYPPDPFKKPVDPEEVGIPKPKERWQSEWSQEYKCLPALIKMRIKRDPQKIKDHTVEYVFDLQVPLIYPKELG